MSFKKDADFVGKAALLKQKVEGVKHRLVTITLKDSTVLPHGNETILRNGEVVGFLRSATYSPTLGSGVGMGYVRNKEGVVTPKWVKAGMYEVEIAGKPSKCVLVYRLDPYPPRVVSGQRRLFESSGYRIEQTLDTLDADDAVEASDRLLPHPLALAPAVGHRRPNVDLVLGKNPEAWWHDPDHLLVRPRLPDDVRIAAEAPLPEAIADDDDPAAAYI